MQSQQPITDSFQNTAKPQLPVIDARRLNQQQLLEQAAQLPPGASKYGPELRALMFIAKQDSDQLALDLAKTGVMAVELDENADQAGMDSAAATTFERLDHVRKYQSTAAVTPPQGTPGARENSVYSKTPSYFDQDLYEAWMKKLSEPYNPDDAYKYDY